MLGGRGAVPVLIVVGLIVLAAVFLPLPPPVLIGLIVVGVVVAVLAALIG